MANFINNKEDEWDEIEIEILDDEDEIDDDEYDEFLDEIEYLYYDDDSEEESEEERVLH